ncbi:hypothetical protein [Paenibacillus tyrfis]|uniref:hypothetical protein n=1 Tax=Paenibacillus tyrfis TaxID=1501230 RepID=UPI00209E25DC|nr:hypothetical protein [Paenibacillus tyrfis]MCP1306419.1 hypothetical protein [Paenibacillus tyrfis]
MTEQEIRNMQPGPDMDILLEVELFGKIRGGVGRNGLVGDGRYYSYPRLLSRSWEGAGLIVEEMRRRGWNVAILTRADGCGVGFAKDGQQYVADSTSAMHAVAMAALLALRGGEQR